MAGIMDMFRKQQPAQQPDNQQQQGVQPNNQTNNNNQGGQGNIQGPGTLPNNNGGQVPTPGSNTGTQSEPKGIDKFSKMWDTTESQSVAPPSFNLDPKILTEVAGSQDFMQGVDPELMEKATNGDVKSLLALINKVGQNAYAKSLEHAGTLTDKFVGAREAHSAKNIGNNVRSELTTSALSAIPNYKHPAVQKQLKLTAEQLAKTHPEATPQEIVAMTIEYHQELAAAMSPAKDGDSADKNSANAPVDWEKWFNEAGQS